VQRAEKEVAEFKSSGSSGSRVGEMRGLLALKPTLGAAKSTRDGRRKLGMMLWRLFALERVER